jgi:transcriptional regulator NrdR family protein
MMPDPDDHPFSPPPHAPWGLCTVCHLAESAHTETTSTWLPKVARDAGHCPECGQRVGTYTDSDGTSYYLARAEQDASELDYVREQRDRLLSAAAAALERVQVEDPQVRYSEAEHILSLVVTLAGKYVEKTTEDPE